MRFASLITISHSHNVGYSHVRCFHSYVSTCMRRKLNMLPRGRELSEPSHNAPTQIDTTAIDYENCFFIIRKQLETEDSKTIFTASTMFSCVFVTFGFRWQLSSLVEISQFMWSTRACVRLSSDYQRRLFVWVGHLHNSCITQSLKTQLCFTFNNENIHISIFYSSPITLQKLI